ncbi:SMP-30/gluconolactonase/LRE family protein [Pseudomonas sp. MLB6B]
MFKTLTDTTSLLGECPVWCERTERLFWTDIPGYELRALDPTSGEVQCWSLPESLGSFALTADEDVSLMGLASCLDYYRLSTGRFGKIAATPGVPGNQINDGRCDHVGNFVFSTMDAAEQVQTIGRFHRFNAATLEASSPPLAAHMPLPG